MSATASGPVPGEIVRLAPKTREQIAAAAERAERAGDDESTKALRLVLILDRMGRDPAEGIRPQDGEPLPHRTFAQEARDRASTTTQEV